MEVRFRNRSPILTYMLISKNTSSKTVEVNKLDLNTDSFAYKIIFKSTQICIIGK